MSRKSFVSLLIALQSMLILSQACTAMTALNPVDEPLSPVDERSNTPSLLTTSIDQPAGSDADTIATPFAVSVTKDIVYATSLAGEGAAGKPWELDTYAPAGVTGAPVIVLLHGFGVSKEHYAGWSEQIAASGAVVYAINAPVDSTSSMSSGNGRGFRQISEVLACAIGYARATAADLGGDSYRVVLVAHSWGTLYGAWFALGSDSLAADWEAYAASHDGPPAQVECEAYSSLAHVEGFVGIGGGRYADVEKIHLQDRNPDLVQIVSPYSYFGQNLDMPIRLLHGEQDGIAKPESSRAFNEALLEAGYDTRFTLFDGGHIVPPELTFETVTLLTGN
jgi:pimeloyl-ACP methyl ester carboxylesterase